MSLSFLSYPTRVGGKLARIFTKIFLVIVDPAHGLLTVDDTVSFNEVSSLIYDAEMVLYSPDR